VLNVGCSVRCLFLLSAKTVCHRIIKSLIPISVVPEAAVLKLVSSVCRNVPAMDTQVISLTRSDDTALSIRPSSVTLVHPAKAVGQSEMPFGRDTRVTSSNMY